MMIHGSGVNMNLSDNDLAARGYETTPGPVGCEYRHTSHAANPAIAARLTSNWHGSVKPAGPHGQGVPSSDQVYHLAVTTDLSCPTSSIPHSQWPGSSKTVPVLTSQSSHSVQNSHGKSGKKRSQPHNHLTLA